MSETLQNLLKKYNHTCSIENIKDGCVTFARDQNYFNKVYKFTQKEALVIIPNYIRHHIRPDISKIEFYRSEYPEYEFTLFHNYLNKNYHYKGATIGDNCNIDKTVLLGIEGLKVINTPSNEKIQFKHTGEVIIGDKVDIGAYSIIHRGTFDETIIGNGCKFGAYTNIGHNCVIGDNVVMAVGVILNGGVKVGNNCWLSSGVKVRHYINICSGVVLGLGSVVVKDITEPGIYVGNPAKYLRPLNEGWNF